MARPWVTNYQMVFAMVFCCELLPLCLYLLAHATPEPYKTRLLILYIVSQFLW